MAPYGRASEEMLAMTSKLQKKIVISIGTRPEIIKMAPVYWALKRMGATPILLHTGQHDELAYPLYDFFGLKPDIDITIQRNATSTSNDLVDLHTLLLQKIAPVIGEIKPDIVAVHGDTLSAMVSAWIAFSYKIEIAHVEAGLRSYHKYQPFPEEKNREIIGRLADFHFAPTTLAKQNLLNEGILASMIHVVGNTIVDAVTFGLEKLTTSSFSELAITNKQVKQILSDMSDKSKMILVTVHRRENLPQSIQSIVRALGELLKNNPEFLVIWPVHANHLVKEAVYGEYEKLAPELRKRMYLTVPLNYPDFLHVLQCAWIIMTDSGGIQEEAAVLHKPVLILRNTTERPEIIGCGIGMLVGTTYEKIIATVTKIMTDNILYHNTPNPFGDGKSADKIAHILLSSSKEKHYAYS